MPNKPKQVRILETFIHPENGIEYWHITMFKPLLSAATLRKRIYDGKIFAWMVGNTFFVDPKDVLPKRKYDKKTKGD